MRLEADSAYLKVAGLEEPGTRLKGPGNCHPHVATPLVVPPRSSGYAPYDILLPPKRLSKPDTHAALKQAIQEGFKRNKHRYDHIRVLPDLRSQAGWATTN